MPRCRSWRFLPPTNPEHPLTHEPGSCRVCWRLCRARTDKGHPRCLECEKAFMQHPASAVRFSLAADHLTRPEVLSVLKLDRELVVGDRAEQTLTDLGHDHDAMVGGHDDGTRVTGSWWDDQGETVAAGDRAPESAGSVEEPPSGPVISLLDDIAGDEPDDDTETFTW